MRTWPFPVYCTRHEQCGGFIMIACDGQSMDPPAVRQINGLSDAEYAGWLGWLSHRCECPEVLAEVKAAQS